jgi:D-alanyl-lipoteichoic acid acyltransferase DltB (MBOAT superfamily)
MVDHTIYFCVFCIIWILFKGQDLEIYETIVSNCFLLIGTVISVYVGGRTLETIKNPNLQNKTEE